MGSARRYLRRLIFLRFFEYFCLRLVEGSAVDWLLELDLKVAKLVLGGEDFLSDP